MCFSVFLAALNKAVAQHRLGQQDAQKGTGTRGSFEPWEWNLKFGVRHPQRSQGKTM